MNWFLRGRVCFVVLGVALATVFAGCQRESKNPFERYIPSSESARAGVTRVMEGWLEGLSPDASGSAAGPEIHVVDQTRRADQHLVRYEILGEVPAENARAFAVRVMYNGTDEPEILRFIAVGVDPMWIFRREDYEGIWQHGEEAPTDRAGEPTKKP